jgi:hypothetical protein
MMGDGDEGVWDHCFFLPKIVSHFAYQPPHHELRVEKR